MHYLITGQEEIRPIHFAINTCLATINLSRCGIVLSALPSIILLSLFYSLAVHMYWRLGGWPTSIGDAGFHSFLRAHAYITMYYFIALIYFGMFVLPVAIPVCLLTRETRRFLIYVALSVAHFAIAFGIMLLAPRPFLDWWWD